MSKYYLYTDRLSDIKRYEENKSNNNGQVKKCVPLQFRKPDGTITNTFSLAELDLLLACQKNEDEFLNSLAKYDQYRDILNKDSHVTLVYKNNELKEKKIIYNNKLLATAAKCVIDEKKRRKQTKEKGNILVPEVGIISDYVNRVKKHLHDKNIVDMLKRDRVCGNPKFSECISQYADNCKNYNYSETEGNYFYKMENKLSAFLRDYSILRQMILFEQKHKLLDQDIKANKDNNYTQLEFSTNKDVTLKEPRKKLLDDDLIEKDSYVGRENDELTYWYNIGGATGILENMDLDDIMSYPEKDLESVGLGYLKMEKDNDSRGIKDGQFK